MFATWRFGGEANHGTSRHANLIETQCHGFDMLEHLVGPIASVMAQATDKTYGDWSTWPSRSSSRTARSARCSAATTRRTPTRTRSESRSTAPRAALVIHDTVRELTISRGRRRVESRWRAGYFDDEARYFAGTFDRHVEAVLAALRAGEEPPVHARAGRRALALAHAVIASHESGTRVMCAE